MTQVLAAIDPGTKKTGIAIFQGTKLAAWNVITAPAKLPAHERIGHIIDQLEAYIKAQPDHLNVTTFACEKTTSMERSRPAPELATLARAIRTWAKGKGTRKQPKREWNEYNPTSVLDAVRVRGLSGSRTPRKEVIRLGVTLLYDGDLQRAAPEDFPSTPEAQDIYDAIAVGHCHITLRHTKALEALNP